MGESGGDPVVGSGLLSGIPKCRTHFSLDVWLQIVHGYQKEEVSWHFRGAQHGKEKKKRI